MAEVEVEQIVEVTDEVNKDKEEDEVEDQPRRMLFPTGLDKDSIREAYEDVRSDQTDTDWAVFKFQNCTITCTARGQGFEEFREQFGENDRAFGYIRIQMGDEMSKRQKFIFLTWIGQYVGVLPRAKMSTDKALIREVLSNFAVELYAGVDDELDIELFRGALERAGGANYGTGEPNW
uniref:Coactosin-like protein n=1 Tax=Bactrocera dorsalis TaxID=27457 RepID=A0A034VIT6_BACDO